jgi:hypothetical protein
MTSTSENVVPIKKKAGRPLGSKNKPKVRRPRVQINVEAILANSDLKKANAEVERLTTLLDSAKSHIEKLEGRHKAALAVIGYLEGKVFQ